MRSDLLALIRGATEFVTVIYGPSVTFAIQEVGVAPEPLISSGRKCLTGVNSAHYEK